jgi:hypothetical protein
MGYWGLVIGKKVIGNVRIDNYSIFQVSEVQKYPTRAIAHPHATCYKSGNPFSSRGNGGNHGRCYNGTAVATTRLTRATRCLGNLRNALPPLGEAPLYEGRRPRCFSIAKTKANTNAQPNLCPRNKGCATRGMSLSCSP